MKWISGFRHFLYWLCLQVRYSLKHLERLSRSVLASLRYTPVRKRRVYLLYCSCLLTYLLVLGIKPGQVYAQEDTPTPTNQPIYVTPVPEVEDFTCPGTQPQGWGEVTPSAYWNLNCGQCVTPVSNYVWPTLDPEIWGTPVPTEIVNITNYEGVYMDYQNVVFPPDELQRYETVNGLFGYLGRGWKTYSSTSHEMYTAAMKIHYGGNSTGSYGFTFRIKAYNYTTNDDLVYMTVERDGFIQGVYPVSPGQSVELDVVTGTFPGTWDYEAILTVYTEDDRDGGAYDVYITTETIAPAGARLDSVIEFMYQQHIWVDPVEEIDSYCSSVQAEGTGTEGDEDTFQLPGINIGVADCVTVAGITVPLDWTDTLFGTGWEDWNLPGMQICFTPIDFGTLTLFGITIDLDLIALGMAGVVLIRLITRS